MFFISRTSSWLSTIAGIPSDEENAIIMKFLAVSIKLTISAWLKQSCSNLAPAFEQSTIEKKRRQKLLMLVTFQPFWSCEASQKVTVLYFSWQQRFKIGFLRSMFYLSFFNKCDEKNDVTDFFRNSEANFLHYLSHDYWISYFFFKVNFYSMNQQYISNIRTQSLYMIRLTTS